MELIIVLIILRVFYSVFQALQRGGKKPSPPQRPPAPTPAPALPPHVGDHRRNERYWDLEGKLEDILKELEGPGKKQLTAPPAAKPVLQPAFGEAEVERQPLQQTAVRSRKPASSLTKSTPLPQALASRQKQTDRHGRELTPAQLLNKDNLLWGIVALEVLSSPRARRPFPFNRPPLP